MTVRSLLVAAVLGVLANGVALAQRADPASDAPEQRVAVAAPPKEAHTYVASVAMWRSAEDVNDWIGARFEYDMQRAIRLSETQRNNAGPLPIPAPEAFFGAPRGVCVDLSRFAVETLRTVDPASKPAYVMIEFAPVFVAGNTLRRHWVATFERDGRHYFFADSKRPGHMAGPYGSVGEFVADYATYRGREVIAFRVVDTYERRTRTMAAKQSRADRP